MRLKSVVNAAAYGISASVLAFGLAANANAQPATTPQTGCQPKAQVEAIISSGGYKPIALGNRVDGVGNANIFFANQEGYGFSAEGDRPLGTPAQKEICVLDRYKEVRVSDPRNTELPSWVTIKNGNGKDSSNIKKAYQDGMRIVFTALSYDLAKDGSEKLGKTVGIIAGQDKVAAVLSIDYQGNAIATTTLKQFALTNNANAFVVADVSTHMPTTTVATAAPTLAKR